MGKELIQGLVNYGPLGIISAYFLWNDYLDRKSYRGALAQIEHMGEKVNDHEKRIRNLEIKGVMSK